MNSSKALDLLLCFEIYVEIVCNDCFVLNFQVLEGISIGLHYLVYVDYVY